jgi:hypothetical protein
MNQFFEERDIKSNVKKLLNVFNIISLTSKYKIIGSSNLKNIRYNSDYDLSDFYENTKPNIKKIVKYFQSIYKNLDSKNSYSYITDFKCGLNSNNEPLKWTKKEIMKNKKLLLNGNYINLNEALQQKSTIKIDVVSFINNTFIEISENYYIKLNGKSNFDDTLLNEKNIIESIQNSEKEEVNDNNYNKALKRNFSWRYAKNKKDKILIVLLNFFNSSVGILNKARSDLDVLILILEKKLDVKLEQLLVALDNIKFQLSYNTIKDYTKEILKLETIKTKKRLYTSLISIREDIYNVVNKFSKDLYLQINKKIKNKLRY